MNRPPSGALLRMFAISAPGLERIVADELRQLGIAGAQIVDGGVDFGGTLTELYQTNLWLRTASRVLVRLDEFHASSFHELERRVKRIAWEKYVSPGSQVQFRVTCRKSRLYHSDAVAERFGEGLIQRVPGATVAKTGGKSASEGELSEGPDDEEDSAAASQLFVVRLTHDNCLVSVDGSGSLLHRRGYRQAIGKAPLRETLAAAMILASQWDGHSPLVDPMCGSGTIAIEAALIARGIAPGMKRPFAFQQWPNYDRVLWDTLREDAAKSATFGATVVIMASDRDDGAVKSAMTNADRAGVAESIRFDVLTISELDPPAAHGWIVTNPPYGVRVGERQRLRNLYERFGQVIRTEASGYQVALLSADRTLESALHLDLKEVLSTRNGGIPVRLLVGSAV
jgi:putative N6-adenine-specific DNA methylase